MISAVIKSSPLLICVALHIFINKSFSGDISFNVRVLDFEDKPIASATVFAVWAKPRAMGTGWGRGENDEVQGLTNDKGEIKLVAPIHAGIVVEKPGYYQLSISDPSVIDPKKSKNLNDQLIQLKLTRKTNPLPMYVRSVKIKLPNIKGLPCGFDLVAGDWVGPAGNGSVSDMVFSVIGVITEQYDWDQDATIEFPSNGAGIVEFKVPNNAIKNELLSPLLAPIDGYMKMLKWTAFSHQGKTRRRTLKAQGASPTDNLNLIKEPWSNNDNYIFKVRTNPDGTGGMYGKIYGPIKPVNDGLEIEFTYYLNPSGSRGLEWDSTNNLAGDREFHRRP